MVRTTARSLIPAGVLGMAFKSRRSSSASRLLGVGGPFHFGGRVGIHQTHSPGDVSRHMSWQSRAVPDIRANHRYDKEGGNCHPLLFLEVSHSRSAGATSRRT